MGTNYYADWNPNPGGGGPASLLYPKASIHLHICKSLSMFQGQIFNSWDAWKNFLTRNQWEVTITDEYGATHEVPQFIADVESVSLERRGQQYRWVVEHGQSLDHDWLCPDGFSFYAGEFS